VLEAREKWLGVETPGNRAYRTSMCYMDLRASRPRDSLSTDYKKSQDINKYCYIKTQ